MKRARWKYRLAGGLATLALATSVGWAAAATPATPTRATATIAPGFDLFETDPSHTAFAFQAPCTAIPPGFFGPGSDPFQGAVAFGGVPLKTFAGHSVGDADTIVQRTQPANPNPNAQVPIELVALSLHSVQPITVRYNGGASTERWDVSVALSPTAHSQGSAVIHAPPLSGGGTFDSQLQVIPKMTFTRISDAQMKTFDLAVLPFQCWSYFDLQQTGGVWRSGCVLPALGVAGLNDGFCPGLTPTGNKQLTVEQSLLAQHGVYPAQPALEHFECYRMLSAPFKTRHPVLSDQFLSGPASVSPRAELCNPAQKNAEPFVNRAAHLQCYVTTGPDVNKAVSVDNQLGSQRLVVHRPVRLCLPSQKRLLTSTFKPFNPKTIDHFRCYAVAALGAIQTAKPMPTVTLKDQFGSQKVTIGKPLRLCAPVAKTLGTQTTPMRHPVKHLVCYAIANRPIVKRVEILNQFERVKLQTVAAAAFCVPSNKVVG